MNRMHHGSPKYRLDYGSRRTSFWAVIDPKARRERGPEHGSARQRRRKGESRPGFIGPLVDGTNKSNESIRTHNELPILIGSLHRLGVPLALQGLGAARGK